MPTIQVILAMAAIHNLHYLNKEVDYDIYMKQFEGFAVGDPGKWSAC